MEVQHFVTLYLTTATAAVVDAVQGDGVRVIAARLMEGAEAWPVPEGVSAGIGYELPDKTGGYYDRLADGTPACMIAGDLVTAAIDGSLTAIPGNVKLSIVLRDSDGGQVATFPVTMRVAKLPGRIGAEEMAPVSAFDGKLIMGGAGGETIPVSVGTGLHIQRLGNGAVLTAPGGSSEAPGGSCDCGDAYVASDEPPEDTDVLWVDTSEPGEAVALGATVVETEKGATIYATDELGTTKATVRHGRDGAPGEPGKTPVKGEDYFTQNEIEEVARQAAGLVEVPGGGGREYTLLYDNTITLTEPVSRITDSLLVSCEGMTEFVAFASWTANENTQSGNKRAALYIGHCGTDGGGFGDISHGANGAYRLFDMGHFVWDEHYTNVNSIVANGTNIAGSIQPRRAIGEYNTFSIKPYEVAYQGTITVKIVGR